MQLSELKKLLATVEQVSFRLEDGTDVPAHFHVTEVGSITKDFIDCGGTIRHERVINFQLWSADDLEHRLLPAKLLHIITLSEDKLGIEDGPIEVEYQSATIGKYDLEFAAGQFILKSKKTACLAEDQCGITPSKPKVVLTELGQSNGNCCTPGSGCC